MREKLEVLILGLLDFIQNKTNLSKRDYNLFYKSLEQYFNGNLQAFNDFYQKAERFKILDELSDASTWQMFYHWQDRGSPESEGDFYEWWSNAGDNFREEFLAAGYSEDDLPKRIDTPPSEEDLIKLNDDIVYLLSLEIQSIIQESEIKRLWMVYKSLESSYKDNGIELLKTIFENFRSSDVLNDESVIDLYIGNHVSRELFGIIRINKWINIEIENIISKWKLRTTLDTTKIIQEVERTKSENDLKLKALAERFNEECSRDLAVRISYDGHSEDFEVNDWNPSLTPVFSENDNEVENILREIATSLKESDSEKTEEECYLQAKDEHLDGIKQTFEEAVYQAIEDEWDELSDIASNFQIDVIEIIIEDANYSILGITKKQLETILTLSTNYVDASNPIYGYLDDIIKGLTNGFSDISQELVAKHKDELQDLSVKYIYQHEKLKNLRDRYIDSIKTEDKLDKQRMLIICAQSVNKVVSEKIKALQAKLKDYVVDNDHYQSGIEISNDYSSSKKVPASRTLLSDLPDDTLGEYDQFLREAENYYKIFPIHSTAKSLGYISNRNPNTKSAEPLDLEPIFFAMRKKGQEAHLMLSKRILAIKILNKEHEKAKKEIELNLQTISLITVSTLDKKQKKEYNKLTQERKFEEAQNIIERVREEQVAKQRKIEEGIKLIEREILDYTVLMESNQASSSENTNIFIPCFLFLVSTNVAQNSKKFFRVDFEPDWLPYFISSDQDDLIFSDHKTQVNKLKAEEDRFFNLIEERANLYYWKSYKTVEESSSDGKQIMQALRGISGHSERVLTEALRNLEIIKYLITTLRRNMIAESYSFEDITTTQYKIYGVALLGHSTQVICHHCVRAFVAQQNSHEEGTFIQLLSSEINKQGTGFKAHEYSAIKKGIRLTTIIVSDRHYDEEKQSKLVREFPSTMITFENSVIDLKNANSLAMIELYNPILESSQSINIRSKIPASGSFGGKKLVTNEERKIHPEVDDGKFPEEVKARKTSLCQEAKSHFASQTNDLVDSLENAEIPGRASR